MAVLSAACQQLTVVTRRSADRCFPAVPGGEGSPPTSQVEFLPKVDVLHLHLGALQGVYGHMKIMGKAARALQKNINFRDRMLVYVPRGGQSRREMFSSPVHRARGSEASALGPPRRLLA